MITLCKEKDIKIDNNKLLTLFTFKFLFNISQSLLLIILILKNSYYYNQLLYDDKTMLLY